LSAAGLDVWRRDIEESIAELDYYRKNVFVQW